jgi:hypothetical protein
MIVENEQAYITFFSQCLSIEPGSTDADFFFRYEYHCIGKMWLGSQAGLAAAHGESGWGLSLAQGWCPLFLCIAFPEPHITHARPCVKGIMLVAPDEPSLPTEWNREWGEAGDSGVLESSLLYVGPGDPFDHDQDPYETDKEVKETFLRQEMAARATLISANHFFDEGWWLLGTPEHEHADTLLVNAFNDGYTGTSVSVYDTIRNAEEKETANIFEFGLRNDM